MFYKYESTLDNDLIFWSNATADLRHNGEIGEDDLPDELLHALNELWTDGHLVSCYLVELKGRYGIALESIYDRDFAESLGITYGELVKRVEKKANYNTPSLIRFSGRTLKAGLTVVSTRSFLYLFLGTNRKRRLNLWPSGLILLCMKYRTVILKDSQFWLSFFV